MDESFICRGCPQSGSLPPSSFRFVKSRRGRLTRVLDCRECERKKASASRRARYATKEGRQAILASNRRYQSKPDVSARISKASKAKYATDEEVRDRIKGNAREWRTNNREKKAVRAALYYQENRDDIVRRAREREEANPWMKLRGHIRTRVHEALKDTGRSKGGKSITRWLPYTLMDLRTHIESQFEDWMTWSNYGPLKDGRRTWQLDHIVPQSLFSYDSMDSEEFRLCWDLKNLRPLDSVQNVSDGNRMDLLPYSSFREIVLSVVDATTSPITKENPKLLIDKGSRISLGASCPMSRSGISYLDTIFVKRFHAKTANFPSLIEAANDPKLVMRVVIHLVTRGDKVTPGAVLRNLKYLHRTPGHFFPMAALALWKAYAPPASAVFDPFLGWGGRTLGAFCSNVPRIVGCDLQKETVEGCRQIADDFHDLSSTSSEFHHEDALQFLRATDEKFGMIFTSPPYLDSEDYGVESDAMKQDWIESFVFPFASELRRVILPNGKVAMHLKDISGAPTFTAYHASLLGSGFRLIGKHRYGSSWTQSVCVYSR